MQELLKNGGQIIYRSGGQLKTIDRQMCFLHILKDGGSLISSTGYTLQGDPENERVVKLFPESVKGRDDGAVELSLKGLSEGLDSAQRYAQHLEELDQWRTVSPSP